MGSLPRNPQMADNFRTELQDIMPIVVSAAYQARHDYSLSQANALFIKRSNQSFQVHFSKYLENLVL